MKTRILVLVLIFEFLFFAQPNQAIPSKLGYRLSPSQAKRFKRRCPNLQLFSTVEGCTDFSTVYGPQNGDGPQNGGREINEHSDRQICFKIMVFVLFDAVMILLEGENVFWLYDVYLVYYLRFTKKSNSKISQKSHFSGSSAFNIENNS